MPRRVWQLDLDTGQHTIELHHGQLSGRRVIRVDGELVCRSATSEDAFSAAPTEDCFRIGDHECYLVIRPNISGAIYLLVVDGFAVEPINAPSQSTPSEWTWVLAVPVLVSLMVLLLFELLARPDQAPIDVLPPVLRDPALCVVAALAGVGAVGLMYFVFVDLYSSARMRRLGRPVLLLLATTTCALSIWLWAADGSGWVGIPQAIRLGAPAWSVAVPLIALATMAVLASNRAGMYDASALLGFALFMLSCALADQASWDTTQGRLRPGPGSTLTPLLGVVQTLVAGALALHEAKDVRLDSWFGRLYYLGTYGHYRDLHRLARERHLEAVGPGPETEFGVWMRGTWHDRYIGIASDNRGLLVQVSSEIKLWPLLLVSGRRARKSGTGEGLWAAIPDARARGKQLYLHPPDGQEPGPEAIEALRGAVLSGQRFLKSRAQIWTDEATVVFHWSRIVFNRWKAEEVAGILDWLARIAQTMETLGMGDCAADGAEATAESTHLE